MLDAAACGPLRSAAQPVVSAAALAELRALLSEIPARGGWTMRSGGSDGQRVRGDLHRRRNEKHSRMPRPAPIALATPSIW